MNNDVQKELTAEEWDQLEKARPAQEAKKYGRTYRKPAAIPLGTTLEDAQGHELIREEDGWRFVDERMDAKAGALSVTSLSFPVRVVVERSGDRKPRGNDRDSRRERGRKTAKARAARTMRQVHAAEAERERSRLEALEDRDRARNGEEVGA